jgi:hypothetical protein
MIAREPITLQLRYLQTLTEIAIEEEPLGKTQGRSSA